MIGRVDLCAEIDVVKPITSMHHNISHLHVKVRLGRHTITNIVLGCSVCPTGFFLYFRLDSQSLVCVHSVDLKGSWLFLTVFLIISRGPTLFIFLYISFA